MPVGFRRHRVSIMFSCSTASRVPRACARGEASVCPLASACRVSVRAGEGGPRDSPHEAEEAAPNPKKPRGVGGNRPGPNTLEGSCLSRSNRLSEVMAGDVATERRHRMSHEPSLSKNAGRHLAARLSSSARVPGRSRASHRVTRTIDTVRCRSLRGRGRPVGSRAKRPIGLFNLASRPDVSGPDMWSRSTVSAGRGWRVPQALARAGRANRAPAILRTPSYIS